MLRPRVGSAVVLSVASAAFVVAAVRSDGFNATKVEMDDGVVWVYNSTRNWVSRINTQSAEAESGVSPPFGGAGSLLQDGDVVYQASASSVARFDPRTGGSTATDGFPPAAQVVLGGGAGALIDRDSGDVWVVNGNAIEAWKPTDPVSLTVARGSLGIATGNGDVLLIDRGDGQQVQVWKASMNGDDVAVSPVDTIEGSIPEAQALEDVTAIGDVAAILVDSELRIAGRDAISAGSFGAAPALQHPYGSGGELLLASDTGLYAIPVSGGDPEQLWAGTVSEAARPVRAGSCVYAAWGGDLPQFLQQCGDEPPVSYPVPDAPAGISLQFVSNRTDVVLDGGGDLKWVVKPSGLVLVRNWDEVQSVNTNESEVQQEITDPLPEEEERRCESAPAPPTVRSGAVTTFGARPGTSVVIDAIGLFEDPNCDPLAVVEVSTDRDTATAQPLAVPINFGQEVQLRAPVESGPVTVELTVNDGTPGHDVTARLTVEVSSSASSPPRLRNAQRTPTTTVAVGSSVEYNVLADYIDPDGDELTLTSVVGGGGATFSYGPDGRLVYQATGVPTGEQILEVVVEDLSGQAVEGSLRVVVQPASTQIPPVARDDYARGKVGVETIVRPLLNDTDANGDLASVQVDRESLAPGLTVSGPDATGALVLSALEPATYVIRYSAADSTGQSADASIRFDVAAADSVNRPPVAVRDSVTVRPGRTANIDVLVNDEDADGDLLAVVNASFADGSSSQAGARVLVLDRRYVRVEVGREVVGGVPLVVRYSITDGMSDPVEGEVRVAVPPEATNQPPIVGDDELVVRANQVGSVAVLANDRDPDGDQLFVRPDSVKLAGADASGIVWLDGSTIRYKAGSEPTLRPVIVQYQVEDDPDLSGLQPVSGIIEVTVKAADEANQPPELKPLELRVFTNATAVLRVPLTGIDPNGDQALLRGIDAQGALGVADVVGDTLVYRAGSLTGPDQFTYVVEDSGPGGQTARGLVRVVVAAGLPHPPVPLNDRVIVRPGRPITANVLLNDSDPDGDVIELVDAQAVSPGLEVSVSGTRVEVDVPQEPGVYVVEYRIKDDRSPDPQAATLTIEARADAPLQPPVARDDPEAGVSDAVLRSLADPEGTDVQVAEVEVTANDDDPDGSSDVLVASLVAGQPNDASDLAPLPRGVVRVRLTDSVQWMAYEVTDRDGNAARAVVRIPSLSNQAPDCPAAETQIAAVQVPDGGPITLRIDDIVTDPDAGDTPQLQGILPQVVTGGGQVSGREGDYDSFTYTADPAESAPFVLLQVEVEDRRGQANSVRTTCFFRIGVERTNDPPSVRDFTTIIEQGDTEGRSFDLRSEGYVSDSQGDELTYDFGEAGAQRGGVTVGVSASGLLSVRLDEDAVPGPPIVFEYTVTDGQPTTLEPVRGRVVVQVASTSRRPPLVQPFVFDGVQQGEPITQDVLAGSDNPFPDTPLVVGPVSIVSGRGEVTLDGSEVRFTPDRDFFGQAVVSYSVSDKIQRKAANTLTYNVIGPPLKPGQPTIEEVSSRRVVIKWAPASAQGTPVREYVVQWAGGELNVGQATSAIIDGLRNGVPVSFTVVARSDGGESPPSDPSVEVTPNEVPAKPAPPVITDYNDGSLTVTWVAPAVDGTPITEYVLFSSSGDAPRPFGPNVFSTVWTGLENGTPYTFSLVARNAAGPSDRSDPTVLPVAPATVPDAPAKPTVTDAGDGIEPRLRVSWVAPADNGRPISGYVLTEVVSGQVFDFSTDPSTTQSVPVALGLRQFIVVAMNAKGSSAASPPSDAVASPTRPGTVSLAQPPNDQDRSTTLSFTALSGDATGRCAPDVVTYEFRLNGGSPVALPPSNVIGNLVNGTTYTVEVRAKNCKYVGDWSNPRTFRPSGPPIGSNITGGAAPSGDSIVVTWDAYPAANGAPITSCSVTGGGFPGSTQCAATNVAYYVGYLSGSRVITVSACDALGRCGSKDFTSPGTGSPPPGTVSVGIGSATTAGGCVAGDTQIYDAVGCYFARITMNGWSGTHSVRCFMRMNGSTAWTLYSSFTAGNGVHQACSFSSAGRVIMIGVDTNIGGNAQIGEAWVISPGGAISNQSPQWPTN